MAYHLFRSCLLITEPSELMAISKYIYVWFINKTIFDKKELPAVLHKSKKALKREATLKIQKKILMFSVFTRNDGFQLLLLHRIELQGALILLLRILFWSA